MNKIAKLIILIFFFKALLVYGYEPIAATEDLYLRDVPIYYGLENTKNRLKNIEGPIWALNLSGGSARAFAHIGVLKKMEEEGLRPDVIITNSMGSIVGLAYAAGMSVADIEDMVNTLKLSEFFDIVFPVKGGLIDLHRFEALMYAIFGEMNLSETAIPVFVVTEDLKTKRQIILSEGNLVKVLKASFALPFYFEPVNIENFRLVDGGTSALVPILPFVKLLPNMVVSSTFYDAEINLKNPVTILNVTMDISKSRRSVKQIKEFKPFLIRCKVEDISFMAFDEGDRIISQGYDSANDVLPGLFDYLNSRGIYSNNNVLEQLSSTEQIHKTWQKVKIQLNQAPLPVKEYGWSVKPGLEAWHSFGNSHYLNQNYFPALKTSIWFNRSFLEGMIFYTKDQTGTILRWEQGFNSFLYLNIESQINFSLIDNNLMQYNGNYFFTETGAIFPFGNAFFEPGITAEFINIEDNEKLNYFLRPGIKFTSAYSNFDIDLRYLIRKNNGMNTYGLSAEYIGSVSLGNDFAFATRAYAKSAITNLSTGVEITFNDYYRSRGNSIASTLNGYFPSYLILNGNFTWDIGKYMSTLGEILTLKETTIYFFSDLLITDLFNYNGKSEIHPTLGIGTDVVASLLGLKPYILSFFGGWDIEQISPFIAFSMGTVFK